MTVWRAAWPATLAGVLAAALAAVLLQELRPAGSVSSRATVPVRASTSPSLPELEPPDVAAMLARPLFAPTRRPMAASAAAPTATVPAEVPPRLVGVMLSGPRRSAILAMPGERFAVVAQGQRVGAFLVQGIEPDAVTLLGAQGEQVLRLAFLMPGGPAPLAAALPVPPDQPAPRGPGLFPGLPAVRFGPAGLPAGMPQAPS